MFAFVVRWSEWQVRFRYLYVIAENLVKANLERGDAGAFALAFFHGGDDLLAVLTQIAQLIEFGMVTAADHARIGGEGWRLVGDGAFEAFADVSELVELLVELAKKFAAADGRRREEIFQDRKLRERLAQGDEFARGWQDQE